MADIRWCPKCGEAVYGVTYKVDPYSGRDYLQRLCRCGYRWSENCHDDKRREEPPHADE